MNKSSIELYLQMGVEQPIIDWLISEGVKTQEEANEHLEPIVRSNLATYLGHSGGTLSNTSKCLDKVLKHFKKGKTTYKKQTPNTNKSEVKTKTKKVKKAKVPYPKIKSILSDKEIDLFEDPKKKVHPSKVKPKISTVERQPRLMDHHI